MQDHLTPLCSFQSKNTLSFQRTKFYSCSGHSHNKPLQDLLEDTGCWAVFLIHSFPSYYSKVHKINGLPISYLQTFRTPMVNKAVFLEEELQNKCPLCWKQCMYARLGGMALQLRSLGLGSKKQRARELLCVQIKS